MPLAITAPVYTPIGRTALWRRSQSGAPVADLPARILRTSRALIPPVTTIGDAHGLERWGLRVTWSSELFISRIANSRYQYRELGKCFRQSTMGSDRRFAQYTL